MFDMLDATLVGLTWALVEVWKGLGTPARFLPVTALFTGTVLQFLMMPENMTWQNVVLYGLATGLMAVGLFSGVKNTLGK